MCSTGTDSYTLPVTASDFSGAGETSTPRQSFDGSREGLPPRSARGARVGAGATAVVALRYPNLVGAAASGLCAVHCVLTPLLFAAKPTLEAAADRGHDHADGYAAWALFDYGFLALSLVAVYFSARRALKPRIRYGLWGAWGLFAIGVACEPLGLAFGAVPMHLGSGLLIVLHVREFNRHGWRRPPGRAADAGARA